MRSNCMLLLHYSFTPILQLLDLRASASTSDEHEYVESLCLTTEENARLSAIGPETPIGKLLRRYWLSKRSLFDCHG